MPLPLWPVTVATAKVLEKLSKIKKPSPQEAKKLKAKIEESINNCSIQKCPKGLGGKKTIVTTPKQLQKKFKHAEDFGIPGNYSPANAKKFDEAIKKHLNSSETKEISGTYRGNPVTFHIEPNKGLTVIQKQNGEFLSAWKLNPQQKQHVLTDGKL